jgi:hypothetical protein
MFNASLSYRNSGNYNLFISSVKYCEQYTLGAERGECMLCRSKTILNPAHLFTRFSRPTGSVNEQQGR